ncbi:hypothetical protein Tco_0360649 [Tanacetum coccineum]
MGSLSKNYPNVSELKLLYSKLGYGSIDALRLEQYLTHTDYALWEVIVNGDAPAVASTSAKGPIPPQTAEQKFGGNKDQRNADDHYKAQYENFTDQDLEGMDKTMIVLGNSSAIRLIIEQIDTVDLKRWDLNCGSHALYMRGKREVIYLENVGHRKSGRIDMGDAPRSGFELELSAEEDQQYFARMATICLKVHPVHQAQITDVQKYAPKIA